MEHWGVKVTSQDPAVFVREDCILTVRNVMFGEKHASLILKDDYAGDIVIASGCNSNVICEFEFQEKAVFASDGDVQLYGVITPYEDDEDEFECEGDILDLDEDDFESEDEECGVTVEELSDGEPDRDTKSLTNGPSDCTKKSSNETSSKKKEEDAKKAAREKGASADVKKSAEATKKAAAEKANRKVLKGGVVIETLMPGKGPTIANGQKADLRYIGTLASGKRFDSGNLSVRVGAGEVIPGFDAGLAGMAIKEKRRIFIPAKMGYGHKRVGSIPPNSDLVFEVTLNNISKK